MFCSFMFKLKFTIKMSIFVCRTRTAFLNFGGGKFNFPRTLIACTFFIPPSKVTDKRHVFEAVKWKVMCFDKPLLRIYGNNLKI